MKLENFSLTSVSYYKLRLYNNKYTLFKIYTLFWQYYCQNIQNLPEDVDSSII